VNAAPPRMHLIAPSAPPKVCGVGDHTFLLAARLAARMPTRVHCGQTDPVPLATGSDTRLDFDSFRPWTLGQLSRGDEFQPQDTLFFQYTNFAYGRWGFNPWLAPALRRWRAKGLRIATMFHETYTDQRGPKGLAMRTWQRIFFRQVGKASHLCLFSVDPWTEQYRSCLPHSRVETLAVGSNIPRVPLDRARERRSLGIPDGVPVLGVFGGTHPSRLFEWIESSSRYLTERNIDHRILRIGPNATEVAARLAGAPLIELGIQDAERVSIALSCCDLFLSPISDGASSRRGSLLAGLGHGLPCISTLGFSSDNLFRNAAGTAVEYANDPGHFATLCQELCNDPERRSRLGSGALAFHDRNFGWDSIADRLLDLLKAG